MKREIKFRVWHPKAKLLELISGYGGADEGVFNLDDGEKNDVWLQYTGLKDKNGVEIYENDYLEIPEESDNSKTWCVFWGSGKYILQNISTGDILDCNETNTRNKTIIGNTFESPREHKAVASDL